MMMVHRLRPIRTESAVCPKHLCQSAKFVDFLRQTKNEAFYRCFLSVLCALGVPVVRMRNLPMRSILLLAVRCTVNTYAMNTPPEAVAVVQTAYAAFGRGDIPGVLDLIADEVEWKFCGSKGLPYSGTFRSKEEIAKWFASISEVEEILAFEPREFISEGEKVAVLGWERSRVRSRGKVFESEWVHLFTTRHGRIVRFWGMYDTEASAEARA